MKVLIISYFFPPLNSIASLRPYSWAKYFAEEGIDVTVLTSKKYKFENDLELPFNNFKVIEIPIPKPFKLISFGKLINFLNRKYQLGIYYKVRFPDETIRWVKPAFEFAKQNEWDVVISSALPYTVHEVAWKLKKNGNCKLWVADWRDLFSENPIFTGIPLFKNIEKNIEKKYNNEADLVITVSEGLKNYWVKTTNKPVKIIYNGFFEEDYQKNGNYNPSDVISIFYAGSFYKEWLIDYFFESLGYLREQGYDNFKLVVAGAFDIKEKVKNLRVPYEYKGFIKREEVIKLYFESDFLLFPLEQEKDLPNWKGILTGKIYEYLAVNLFTNKPIIIVGQTFDKERQEILEKSGCCIFLKNQQETINFFENYFKTKKVNINPNHEFIKFFSRKNQAQRLLGFIKEMLEWKKS